MPAWFTEADLTRSPPSAQRLLVDICRLLDQLHPSELAIEQQTATDEDGEIVIRLVHISDRDADLVIEVGDRTTHVYGLHGHDDDYAHRNDPEEAWRAASIDTIASLLRGRYQVECSSWRGRPYRTRVKDIIGNARDVTKLDSFLGWLPLPQRALAATTREVGYGCTGNFPTGDVRR